jgi:hypothetical protein
MRNATKEACQISYRSLLSHGKMSLYCRVCELLFGRRQGRPAGQPRRHAHARAIRLPLILSFLSLSGVRRTMESVEGLDELASGLVDAKMVSVGRREGKEAAERRRTGWASKRPKRSRVSDRTSGEGWKRANASGRRPPK